MREDLSLSDILFITFFWLILLAYVLAVIGCGTYYKLKETLHKLFYKTIKEKHI